MKQKITTRQMVLTAVFIALGVIIPWAFHSVPNAWTFLPMHLPALVAGLLLGPVSGLLTGAFSVVLSGLITGMPPVAKWLVMIPELASYGLFAGLFQRLFKKDYVGTLISLVLAMLAGRVVYALMKFIEVQVVAGVKTFTFQAFIAGAFAMVIAGIIMLVVIVPPIVLMLRKLLENNNR